MRVMATDFQRARRPEHKAQRREAILAAAATLAARDGVRAVSLSAIADEVGIHKSALLRYFETREQIFLELTGRAWSEWADATTQAFSGARADDVPALLARSFADRPLLCDLIPHTALHLEHRVSVERVHEYKLTSIGSVRRVADALAGPVPELGPEQRLELMSIVSLLAGGMWQIANPPPALAELYVAEPDLGHFAADFPGRLRRATEVALAGLRALP
jgi:AcrR family transcriptional regulator